VDALGGGRPPAPGTSSVSHRAPFGHHSSRCTSWLLGVQSDRLWLEGQCLRDQTMFVPRRLGLPSVASISSGLPSSRPHLESLQHQVFARVSPLLVWRPSAMGHPASVMVLAGGPSWSPYPGALLAHPPASHGSCRPAPPRTSLASHREQLSCSLYQNHGDPSRLHDIHHCRLRGHNPIPSLASSRPSFHTSSILNTSPSLPCLDVHGSHHDGRVVFRDIWWHAHRPEGDASYAHQLHWPPHSPRSSPGRAF